MSFKAVIVRNVVPQRLYRVIERWRNRRQLRREARRTDTEIDTSGLMRVGDLDFSQIFGSATGESQWQEGSARLSKLSISNSAGGVNPGDRRALYQLFCKLKPNKVLEVGTHIGASTVYLADAMRSYISAGHDDGKPLVTVDIIDVNDEQVRPWEQAGEDLSPTGKLELLGLENYVRFVARPSLSFLSDTDKSFDLIFLDGDHSASTVYKELPVALKRLRKGGCVVLHDFFPHGEPLWSNGAVVSGPYLAVNRLQAEGLQIDVRPLGELPWECKLASRVTSLAIVGR